MRAVSATRSRRRKKAGKSAYRKGRRRESRAWRQAPVRRMVEREKLFMKNWVLLYLSILAEVCNKKVIDGRWKRSVKTAKRMMEERCRSE